MAGRRSFLKSFFGSHIRQCETDGGKVAKAPDGTLVMTPFLGGDFYFLHGPVGWKPTEYPGAGLEEVTVPRGFVTDLASIPSVLWPILPKDGPYVQPAVVHDFHYWTQSQPKSIADHIFKLGMMELGVPRWKSAVIFYAVSWLGERAWRNNAMLKSKGEGRILRELPRQNVTWQEWKARPAVLMDVSA